MTAPTLNDVRGERRTRAYTFFRDNTDLVNTNAWSDIADQIERNPETLNNTTPGNLTERGLAIPVEWRTRDALIATLHQSLLMLLGRDLNYARGTRVRLLDHWGNRGINWVGIVVSAYHPDSSFVDLEGESTPKWLVVPEPGIDWSDAEAVKEAWVADMAKLSDALNGEAMRRRWCGEYETFQNACNEWLIFELTARDQEYSCSIKVEVTFEWEDRNDSRYHQGTATLWFRENNTATDGDAAMDMVNTSTDQWEDQARNMISSLGYINDFDVTNVEVDSVELAD